MKFLSQITSYLFHPLFAPLIGCVLYYGISPQYLHQGEPLTTLLPIGILTILIPIFCFFILKQLGLVDSIFLDTTRQRILPYILLIGLLLATLLGVIPKNPVAALHYFLVGYLYAISTALLLALFKVKISMHLLALGSILMYVIALSLHYGFNLTPLLAFWIFSIGLVSSARLYLKAHTPQELLVGLGIGIVSQLLTLKSWL